MADPTWEFKVDTAGTGTFAGANDTITSYVMAANWQIGFAEPLAPIARDSTATLVVNNSGKQFSPDSGSAISGLTRGKLLRIRATSGATTTLYLGWIKSIEPQAGIYGERTAVIQCEGFFGRAAHSEAFVPVQESATADSVISAVLTHSAVYPPALTGRWVLGVSGYSEIGTTTNLGAVSDYFVFDTGNTVFSYIGDKWSDGVSVLGAIRDTVGREFGRLWIDRSGVMQFVNRSHLPSDAVSDATFSGTMADLDYSYGEDVVNTVTVRARARTVSAGNVTLGQFDKAVKLPANSATLLAFRYLDTTNNVRIAGKNAVAPVQTTDFTANSAADGTGVDYTSSVTAALTNEYATRAEATFTNAAGIEVFLQPGAKIRGKKITDWSETDFVAEDVTSQASFGHLKYTYPFVLDNLNDAAGFADYILNIRKDARGNVKAMTIKPRTNSTLLAQGLARTVLDRITVSETQTGINTDYFIIGEKHTLGAAGKDWTVTWLLEPASMFRYWLLGTSGYGELGTKTFIGPI